MNLRTEGVEITVSGDPVMGLRQTHTKKESGEYLISNLPPGDYRVWMDAERE